MNDVLKDMDDAIGYLIDGLTQRNLQDHVHIVLVRKILAQIYTLLTHCR